MNGYVGSVNGCETYDRLNDERGLCGAFVHECLINELFVNWEFHQIKIAE